MARLDRALTGVAAFFITALSFFPFANWVAGGASIPSWGDLAAGWWSGTLLVLGAAVVLAVLTRRVAVLPGEDLPAGMGRSFAAHPGWWSAGLSATAAVLYLWIARGVLSARPLLVDEIVQVFQGRIYASGSLALPVPAYPEFFSTSHVLYLGGKAFSQFPAGGPAMLALGSLVGAEWIVTPLCGAISVVLYAALVRRVEPRPGVALTAAILFGFAPFIAFMSGSHMNHMMALLWLLLGMLGLCRVMEPPQPRSGDALLLGLGFGVAATIRPLDAAAFALPAGIWLLTRSVRTGRWEALVAAGIGVAVPVAAMLWVNQQTTGSPLAFGYTTLWGAGHEIGFHISPYGYRHTPATGLELLNLYFVRLQSYLFETPFPALAPAIVALALWRRLSPFDRYLFAAAALLVSTYWAYWHDGFYLGPRFMIPLVPLLALWTARAWPAVRERFSGVVVRRAFGFAVVGAAAIALFVSVPLRAQQYRNGMLTPRWNADAAAERAGVRDALVLVRESWVAQMVARMWAVGIPRSDVERQYRNSDACRMETVLSHIEREGLRGSAALQALEPLLQDSARLITSPYTTDPTNRLLPGSRYTPVCLARLRDDQAGYTLHLPLILARGGGVIYARDLHGRDSLLLEQYPDRPVYLLRPPTTAVGAAPRFYLLGRDSLLSAWRGSP